MPIIIPVAPLTRTIRSEGAERVSGEASLVLGDYIENTSHRISKKAVRRAKHARRKTVKAEDILEAIEGLGPFPYYHVSTRIISGTSIKPITRIIRSEGAERVSGEASLVLGAYMANTSHRISKKAVRLAKHAGRKTVKAKDILAATPGPLFPYKKKVKKEDILESGRKLYPSGLGRKIK
jgi:histone H3/H4